MDFRMWLWALYWVCYFSVFLATHSAISPESSQAGLGTSSVIPVTKLRP